MVSGIHQRCNRTVNSRQDHEEIWVQNEAGVWTRMYGVFNFSIDIIQNYGVIFALYLLVCGPCLIQPHFQI